MTGTTQQNSKAQQVHISASAAAGATPVSVTLDPQAQLESDKRAVYRWAALTVILCKFGQFSYPETVGLRPCHIPHMRWTPRPWTHESLGPQSKSFWLLAQSDSTATAQSSNCTAIKPSITLPSPRRKVQSDSIESSQSLVKLHGPSLESSQTPLPFHKASTQTPSPFCKDFQSRSPNPFNSTVILTKSNQTPLP